MEKWLKAKEAAEVLATRIAAEAADWKARGVTPKLAAVMAAGDPASEAYAESKRKRAEKLGLAFELHVFDADVTQARLLQSVEELNADPGVHGIMLELPLPDSVSTADLTAAVDPRKDVDGLSPHNRLAVMSGSPGLYPATPQACIRLLKHYGYTLAGKDAVLIGRGETVGKPLFHLLLRENATVTVCHSRTRDLRAHVSRADILFVAAGQAGLVTAEMIHPKTVIIDAGINETADGKIVGDVAPEAAAAAEAMSPTPGGVGTLTTLIVFENLLNAVKLQIEAVD